MARVLVGGTRLYGRQVAVKIDRGQKLRHVLHLPLERDGTLVPLSVHFFEEQRILLQNGPATRGVGDDGVETVGLRHHESLNVPLRKITRRVASAGMNVKRAATTLRR